jgi:hypothetical protein
VLGDISLGDAARVLVLMQPLSESQFASAMRALGFHVHAPARTAESEKARSPTTERKEVGTGRLPHLRRDSMPADDCVALLEPIEREPITATHWEVKPLLRPTQKDLATPPPHEPLLAPRSAAAFLQRVLSRSVEGIELDIDAIVDTFAHSQPIDRLPRRPMRTMRFGAEVLVDLGDGMQPFERDQVKLVESVRRLAGAERTRVTYFADAPLRGAGAGPAWSWEAYRPPSPGTRVIVLSDVGIGGPLLNPRRALADEWREFVECLLPHDCDAVGLVPYPNHRWPPAVTSLFPILAWDRSTTTAAAFTAMSRR